MIFYEGHTNYAVILSIPIIVGYIKMIAFEVFVLKKQEKKIWKFGANGVKMIKKLC